MHMRQRTRFGADRSRAHKWAPPLIVPNAHELHAACQVVRARVFAVSKEERSLQFRPQSVREATGVHCRGG